MTTALRTALSLSLEFERLKLVSPASTHQQLELRFMSRLRSSFRTFTISDLARTDSNIARLFPESAPKELPPYVPFDPLTLSTLQQAALMRLRETPVSRAVTRRLLEDTQDSYSTPDFHALRDHGLCEWAGGKRMHQLTGDGRVAAEKLERALCMRFAIHLLHQTETRTELQHASCSCGEWHRSFRRGRGTTMEIWRSHGRHVESVTKVEGLPNYVVDTTSP